MAEVHSLVARLAEQRLQSLVGRAGGPGQPEHGCSASLRRLEGPLDAIGMKGWWFLVRTGLRKRPTIFSDAF